MLSFHILFTRKPPSACPLLASEWYSRWPLWRVVKLSSFLRTSPSHITSHFMLFSVSSSSSCCTCSYFSNVLTLYVSIFSRSPLVWWFFLTQIFLAPLCVVSADTNLLLAHTHPCYWGLEALAYLYFGNFRVAELVLRITDRYKLKIVQVDAPTTSHSGEETDNFYNTIDTILEKQTHYTIAMGDFNAQRKLEDTHIHKKERQDVSAWASEMKEGHSCRIGNIKELQDHEHTISEEIRKQGGDGHGVALMDTLKMKLTTS